MRQTRIALALAAALAAGSAHAGDLPFVVISAPITAFRPQDDMMKIVAQLSGTPVFEELVDVDEIAALEPLRNVELVHF